MPPFRGLTDEQIWQIVVYLRTLSGVRTGDPAANATTSRGNRASGETLFFGKANCASCHQVNGRGGIVGPDLSTVARAPADALRQKILNPATPFAAPPAGGRGGPVGRGGAAARPLVTVAKTKDGREIRGVRRNEDTFSLQMVDASGTLHLLDKLQLADVRVENTSLMPGDYGTKLAAGEIDDLVAYLSTLRERDLTIASTSTANRRPHVQSIGERGRRAAELVDVLGQFPRHALFRPQADHGRERRTASDGLDVSDARTFRARGHAARGRRRDVHHAARRGGRARCANGPSDLAIRAAAEGQESVRNQSVQPWCRGRRQPAVLRDARRRAGRARRAERGCRCGKRRSPTRCSATA